MENILKSLLEIIKNAEKIVVNGTGSIQNITNKGKANLITDIDYKTQDFLINSLRPLVKDATFISEEKRNIYNFETEYAWIIDPIDGTTNLVHGIPYFSLSVALVKNKIPVLGVVSNPISKDVFYASRDNGAFLNGERIYASKTNTLKDSLIGFGFPYNRKKQSNIIRLINTVLPLCQDLRRMGSASLDICNVACGRMDGFFEFDLEPWDYAASSLILHEAGGMLTNWGKVNPKINEKSNIIATNIFIHDILQDVIIKTID